MIFKVVSLSSVRVQSISLYIIVVRALVSLFGHVHRNAVIKLERDYYIFYKFWVLVSFYLNRSRVSL